MVKYRYLYRKGRIVVITRHNSGEICKVLARPGQYVFDGYIKGLRILKEGEYIVYHKDLRVDNLTKYIVPQWDSAPLPGILVNETHLIVANDYEKKLRRKGIIYSPNYHFEKPRGGKNEVIVFREPAIFGHRPKIARVLSVDYSYSSPIFELSNGKYINISELMTFYRQATVKEIQTYSNT